MHGNLFLNHWIGNMPTIPSLENSDFLDDSTAAQITYCMTSFLAEFPIKAHWLN
jgi:hypothetical protein